MSGISQARAYLAGKAMSFDDVDSLWKSLKRADEISLARRVLERLRAGRGLLGPAVTGRRTMDRLCQQEALLTSKDSELSTATRHDLALTILQKHFGSLDDDGLDGDAETLGIAGGILKRRWADLGQTDDLRKAATYYERGGGGRLGDDAYSHINAAFLHDLLASTGDEPEARRRKARELREWIVAELPPPGEVTADGRWFNRAARAEALFGLGRYREATEAIANLETRPAPWELETTTRQLATLAHLRESDPLSIPEVRSFFETLLPGIPVAARSALAGKVGLALSGGGFRASFYHLGVLARLAELNVLRHVDVLSCVSGGSIVGACYWLALRNRLSHAGPEGEVDYVALVREVIDHFLGAVATNLRGAGQKSVAKIVWRLLKDGEKGALDPEATATALDEHFYRPLAGSGAPVFMHDLPFTPADHNAELTGSAAFHPGRHNWLRAHKVPVLVVNATTVNTGHAWQFTPTWMGESPWALHEAADSVPRLEWSWYEPRAGWTFELGRAVAASACVPGVFAPVEIKGMYDDLQVQLVDGGAYDNQGTVSLLALNCNVLLVSDACGQLLLEKGPEAGLGGLASYAKRSMNSLMERVRLANYGDLEARHRSGLLRGLMFLHMKAGLDADPIRLPFSPEAYTLERSALSPAGVRREFQKALAELRTDLDGFTPHESHALMACGYQMATWAFQRDLAALEELWDEPSEAEWPFRPMLDEITSTAATTPARADLLKELDEGKRVIL